ncbi:unnamed protein product [Rotaria magnacalcarata]
MNASQTSTSSSLLKDDSCRCNSIDQVVTSYSSKLPSRQLLQDIRLPNIVVFYISINNFNQYESRKKFSVDIQLVSYSFLIRLVNRTFSLQSNFTLIAKEASAFKCNIPVTNDFDVDGCIMNALEENDDGTKQQSSVEFIVYVYPRTKKQIQSDTDDWCMLDETGTNSNDQDDNFEVIEIQNDSILVTIKPKNNRQESFLQKATGWLHGSTNATSNNCLTKREFYQMLDPVTGRLLDEQAFRQKIFDNGCDESIRKIVWCYLLRVFHESMTNDDKKEYMVKAEEHYNVMKAAWQNRYKLNDSEIIALENLIQKDVQRTDRAVKFFDDKENSSGQKLFQILMTYSVYHPEPGYVQGMNDMAAPILYVIRDESLAYACFCALMRHMTSIFHPNGIAMNRRLDLLRKTIRAIDLELWTKIEQCDIDAFRVFETIWASLPIDRFELNNDNTLSDHDDLCPSMLCNQHRESILSSISNTILSSRSSSPTLEDAQSSLDGGDSGYRDEQIPGLSDFNSRSQRYENSTCLTSKSTLSTATCVPLGKWLIHFSSIDDENHFSDMFTIFLCVALLEQNRSSILQISHSNGDSDDFIGSYFTRLVRQHDARHALQLARNYHRQYVLFQMRIKQLLTDN